MSMRVNIAIAILLATSIRLCAQVPSAFLLTADTAWRSKSMLALAGGDAGIASNAVDVSFLETSLLGGHLHRDYLEALLENMPEKSRIGYHANAQLELLNFRDTLFGKPQLGMRAAFSTNYSGFAAFQPQAFETIYLGNPQSRAQTESLGPLDFQNQAWQKFGFGFFHKNTLSGVTLSLVEGQYYRNLHAEEVSLYTSAMADTLVLDVAGNYERSDTTRTGWANGSGIGACVDLDYNLKLNNGQRVVSFSVRNLGFICWNEASEKYTIDNAVHWTGMDVSQWISGSADSLTMPEWRDSLQTTRSQRSMLRPLPTTIALRYLHRWTDSRYWETGCTYTPNRAAVPLVYVGLTHRIFDRVWLSERVNYGGYGGFSIGAEVQWLSSHSWFVRAGSSQLEGWILSVAGGRSGYLTLGKNF
jgi:hypothetical protein